ncbi:hypothetical protein, partial [Pyrobaculum sp.]|uniref:hypothetical protein n=1 Tax=Pyrobaculum sp. TaxID=2004705 RepID=UPI003D14FD2C
MQLEGCRPVVDAFETTGTRGIALLAGGIDEEAWNGGVGRGRSPGGGRAFVEAAGELPPAAGEGVGRGICA